MKRILLILAIISIALIPGCLEPEGPVYPGAPGDTWCNTSFSKRLDVNVNNTAGSALTNYQVFVNLSSNPINESSLRVYNSTDCNLRPHWCENITDGNCTKLWINYSTITASSWTNDTAIYYDNDTASSVSDGDATFEFFDGFEGSSLDSRPTPPSSGDVTISATSGKYEAWPGIAKDSSGILYTVYRTSDTNTHGYDDTGRVVIRNSTDNGTTWSSEITVADDAGTDDRTTNHALLIFNDSGTETFLVTYFQGPTLRSYCRKSTDGGQTWGTRINLSSGNSRATGTATIKLSNGKLLTALYDGTDGAYVAESTDGGDTWPNEYFVNASIGDEPAILELKTDGTYQGKVIMLCRNVAGKFMKSISTDYGHTWGAVTEETQLPVASAEPACLFRLSNGNILVSYTKGGPNADCVLYESTDECTTWTFKKYVVQSSPNDVGEYSSIVQINSTKLLVAWCQNGATSNVYGNFVDYPFPEYKWTQIVGTTAVSDGYAISNGGESDRFQANYGFGLGYAFRHKCKLSNLNVRLVSCLGASEEWDDRMSFEPKDSRCLTKKAGSDEIDAYTFSTGEKIYEATRTATRINYLIDGVEVHNCTDTNDIPTVDLYTYFYGAYVNDAPIGRLDIDWTLVRKYASPEPSSTLGSEEQQGGTPPVISNITNGSISSTAQWIDWDVNQTAHNRVLYSNESDLTPAYYSAWDNSTAAPNITLSSLDPNTQYWYQVWSYNTMNTSLSDNSSTLTFTTASEIPIISKQWIDVVSYNNTYVLYNLTTWVYNNYTSSLNISVSVDNNWTDYNISNLAPSTSNTHTQTATFARPSSDTNFTCTAAILGSDAGGTSNTIKVFLPVDPPSKAAEANNISVLAGNRALLCNWSENQTFQQIQANLTNTTDYFWYNSSLQKWIFYNVSRNINKDVVVNKHNAIMISFNKTTTVSCNILSAETILIPSNVWYYTPLRESTSKTLAEISTDIEADGCVITDLYAWNSAAGAYTNTGTYYVLPNQGFAIYTTTGCSWDGSI